MRERKSLKTLVSRGFALGSFKTGFELKINWIEMYVYEKVR